MNRFLKYFAWVMPFKTQISVCIKPEWKLKTNIARNATFEGR